MTTIRVTNYDGGFSACFDGDPMHYGRGDTPALAIGVLVLVNPEGCGVQLAFDDVLGGNDNVTTEGK